MRNGLLLIFVAVILIIITTSSIYAEDKVDLRLRLEKGQSYKMKTTQDIKVKGEKQEQTLTQKTEIVRTYDVEEVDTNGNAWIKVTYNSIFVKNIVGPEGQQKGEEYDSSNPPDVIPRGAVGFAALIGQSYSIMVSAQGEIKDTREEETLQAAVMKKLSAIPDNEMTFLNEIRKEHISKEALQEAVKNIFSIYPDESVKVGDTWQKKDVSQYGLPMTVLADTIYTLKERKDGKATIDVFSLIQPNFEVEPMKSGTGKIQFKLSGDSTGTIELNESTGWMIHSNQNLRLNGQLIVQEPEKTVTVPMSISSAITQESF